MLKLENIVKIFNMGTINEKKALQGVNITIEDGDFITVIGGNGAGKSTMLNLIAGVFPPEEGRIYLDDKDVTALPEYKRAKFLGRVFQDPMTGTAANMQIQENLALAYRRGKVRGLKGAVSKKEKAMFKEQLALLGLGLEDRMTTKVGLLSGGQRQALTLLMATFNRPDLLLFHYPFEHGVPQPQAAEGFSHVKFTQKERLAFVGDGIISRAFAVIQDKGELVIFAYLVQDGIGIEELIHHVVNLPRAGDGREVFQTYLGGEFL